MAQRGPLLSPIVTVAAAATLVASFVAALANVLGSVAIPLIAALISVVVLYAQAAGRRQAKPMTDPARARGTHSSSPEWSAGSDTGTRPITLSTAARNRWIAIGVVAITGLLIVWLGPKPDPALNWCQENASTVHAYAEGYHTDFETACRLIYRTLVSPGL
jgi:hypothetical protein